MKALEVAQIVSAEFGWHCLNGDITWTPVQPKGVAN